MATPSVFDVFKRLGLHSPARLNLALQGGGAHGAFTWGVLDALLEVQSLEFEGLSGSSAGAMNAVVFADGWLKGGREGARQCLAEFWSEVAQQMPWGAMTRGEGEDISLSPASKVMARLAAQFSPSQINPFELNPLRDLLVRQIDFEALRSHSPFKLFVGTTQANTGRLRVFREHELSVDVLLASACLPKIHHSVEIDGQPYWDGGYAANPPVFPLFYGCDSRDVLLVLLSPLVHAGTPRSVEEIAARIAELSFTSTFMCEMSMFAQAREFSRASILPWGKLERRLQQMRFHMVDSTQVTALQRTETKIIAHSPFLELLRAQGRSCADAWLADHFKSVGQVGTLDLQKWFA